ncbi:hypothetical protein E2C01_095005 [Portunus trituberculatus]|uniref:Uncharacterized protein n=1 Tax=Portunus trituberculatus TaxID=210409 RepID=A0A5B7JU04_PORTR|nr:hypothetical protein [Portunus trituberculatus]
MCDGVTTREADRR